MPQAVRTNDAMRVAGAFWLAFLGGIACAHALPAGVNPPPEVAAAPPHTLVATVSNHAPPDSNHAVDATGRNPTGAQVDRILRQSGLEYVTLEPGKRWKLTFAGHQHPELNVYVIYSDNFTVVLGKLCTLSASTSRDVYKAIAERNFDLEQLKISVNKDREVFASFEVPTRILDRQELLENIVSLAAALDSMQIVDDDSAAPSAPADPAEPEAPLDPSLQNEMPVLQIRGAPAAQAGRRVIIL